MKQRFTSLGFWVLLLLLVAGCAFQSDRITGVEDLMDSLIRADAFSGALVIGNSEGIIYEKQGGLAVREWNIPVQADTRFDIASLNKSFVGVIVMQLTDEGKIKLNDPITKYLPLNSPFADSMTIHQMLTHTSGLPDYDAIADSLKERNFEAFKRMHFSNAEYVDFIGSLPTVGKPGKQFYYSNFAYHLLSILIEKVEGTHFSDVLTSKVCDPLQLKDTYAPVNNYKVYDRLAGSYLQAGRVYNRTPFIDYSLGRRIFSTAHDLYRWGLEMVHPSLLTPASHQRVLSNQIGSINPEVSYGYGWAVFDGKGEYQMGKIDTKANYFIHGGATDGYRSILVVEENGEWIVSMLSNNGGKVNELELAERIIKHITE